MTSKELPLNIDGDIQTLLVDYTDWCNKKVSISDVKWGTYLESNGSGYACSSSSVNFTDSKGQAIGSSKCSSFMSRVDVQLTRAATNGSGAAGSGWDVDEKAKVKVAADADDDDADADKNTKTCSFEMHNSASILGGSPRYISPAFGGRRLTWRNKALSSDIIYTLIDPGVDADVDKDRNGKWKKEVKSEKVLANFRSNRKTKTGVLEIALDVLNEERARDEIMVTLVTLLLRKLRNIQTATLVAVT